MSLLAVFGGCHTWICSQSSLLVVLGETYSIRNGARQLCARHAQPNELSLLPFSSSVSFMAGLGQGINWCLIILVKYTKLPHGSKFKENNIFLSTGTESVKG